MYIKKFQHTFWKIFRPTLWAVFEDTPIQFNTIYSYEGGKKTSQW